MTAKKTPSDSPTQVIEQEEDPLIEAIVAKAAPQFPDRSKDELRALVRDCTNYVNQKVMEGYDVILGDMLLRRKPDKDSPDAKGPRPGYEHLLHVDVEYNPPKVPGLSEDSFPMSLPPNLMTKH